MLQASHTQASAGQSRTGCAVKNANARWPLAETDLKNTLEYSSCSLAPFISEGTGMRRQRAQRTLPQGILHLGEVPALVESRRHQLADDLLE
jgi:hypothetical protein